jgi:hypothetical protein
MCYSATFGRQEKRNEKNRIHRSRLSTGSIFLTFYRHEQNERERENMHNDYIEKNVLKQKVSSFFLGGYCDIFLYFLLPRKQPNVSEVETATVTKEKKVRTQPFSHSAILGESKKYLKNPWISLISGFPINSTSSTANNNYFHHYYHHYGNQSLFLHFLLYHYPLSLTCTLSIANPPAHTHTYPSSSQPPIYPHCQHQIPTNYQKQQL